MIIKKLVFLFLLLNSNAFAVLNDPDSLLKPDEAFKVSANVTDTGQARVVFDIADAYYLYKTKIHFKSKTPDVTLADAQLPKGKIKEDKYLGKMEVLYNTITTNIPLSNQKTASSFDLEVKYQGCAEAGLCYAPQKKIFTLQLASNANDKKTTTTDTATTSDEASTSRAKKLANELGITSITDRNTEPLSPEKAFQYTLKIDKDVLIASWRVTPRHYLYKDRIKFIVKSPDSTTLETPIFPASKTKTDATGTHQVFDSHFNVKIPIKNGTAGDLVIQTRYQGCSDISKICYSPQKKTHKLTLANDKATTGSNNTSAVKNTLVSTDSADKQVMGKCEASKGEQHKVLSKLTNASTIGAIFIFFLIGLGLAFTPCIYPMIPILSSIIVGQGTQVSTQKAFILSLAYVLPMALIYAVAGYFIGNSGESLQAMFQNPWVLSSFAFIFVLLSLSMFGFYDLQMPASIQNKLTNISNSQESGSIIGAAIMGALSALIVGPCVTAPLIAAFTYIAQIGSPLLGTIDMLALGLGIGLPLLLIGTSAGQLLPRAGAWMETTKAIFGVMMLGLAISMLERILPSSTTMSLAAVLLIVTAIYMGALEPVEKVAAKSDSIMSSMNPVEKTAGRWRSMWKGLGLIMLTYGIMLMIGAAAGSGNLYQPLKGVFDNGSQENHEISFQQVKGLKGLNAALAAAKEQKRPVMLDFSASWCSYCKVMERTTFADKNVLDAFENTLFLQSDISAIDDADNSLLKAFGLAATPPMILFFDSNGVEQKDYRLFGEITPEQLTTHAEKFMNCFRTNKQ